jgi:ionotropic glutamate receptor
MQRLLEIMQAGLIVYWDVWFRPMSPQCQENIKSYKPIDSKTLKTKDNSPALTFKNLTGAFIVLLFGLSLSFLTFLCELIISIPNRHTRRFQKGGSNSANLAGNTRNKPSAINNQVENDIQEVNALNHTDKINENESTINGGIGTTL